MGEKDTCNLKTANGLCSVAIKPGGGMFKCNEFTHEGLLRVMDDSGKKGKKQMAKVIQGGKNLGFTQ